MTGDNNDSRAKLYEEFRRAVTAPDARSAFFDEGDLIELFDYAGDQGDDSVRTEVLAMASRLYPDSDDLKIRKAFYYFQMESIEMCRAIVSGQHGDGALWDVLKLRLDPPSSVDAERALDEVFAKYDTLGDEEVIQIINLANAVKRLDWAVTHIDGFRTKTSYMPTCLYEIAVLSSLNGDSETVLKMTEELTRIEPFTEVYWLMMARAHADLMQVDEALSAVDYALAITPDSQEAILLRAQLKALNDQIDDTIFDELKRLVDEDPDNESIVKTLGVLFLSQDWKDEAYSLYFNYQYSHPDSAEVLELLLGIIPDELSIERYYEACDEQSEDEWIEMAERLGADEHYESAACLLDVFHRKEGLTRGFENFVIELYRSGQYKRIEAMLDKPTHPIYSPKFSPMVSLCYVMSMMRNKRSRKVLNFIDAWFVESEKRPLSSSKERLVSVGISAYFGEFCDIVTGEGKRTLDDIDPFIPMIPGAQVY